MSITDSIGNYLTSIRNAFLVGKKVIIVPSSNLKKSITKILFDQGYILSYKFEDFNKKNNYIKIALKYNNNVSVIKSIKRVSKPGLRKYCNSKNIPRILNGLGVAIISTSSGLMIDKEARKKNIGGEILCYIH